MANITKAERERREADRQDHFGGTAYQGLQEQVERTNAADERLPDRRPATIASLETGEVFPDNRESPGDLGKAVNQMAGRAAITENHDIHPGVTAAATLPRAENPLGITEGEGEEVQLLRGYVPLNATLINGQGTKRVPGEVIRLPKQEAKRLVNASIAKFTDA